MSETPNHPPMSITTLCCELVLDGVKSSVFRQADRTLLTEHPNFRTHIEREMRSAVARDLVEKLAPPVVEVRTGSLESEERISREEALRLAQAYTKALAELSLRLEKAGENYALMDALGAVDAGRAMVAKLEGPEGRLPVRPGESPRG